MIDDIFVKVGEHRQTFVIINVTNRILLLADDLLDCYEAITYENDKINIQKLKAFISDSGISMMSITNSNFAIFGFH